MEEKFRISDIYKKSKETQEKRPQASGISFHRLKPEEKKEPGKSANENINFSAAPEGESNKPEVKNDVDVSKLYSETLACSQQIYRNMTNGLHIVDRISSSIKNMVDLIGSDDQELLKSALADYPQQEEYLYYHMVNVCIISLYIGQGLAYDRPRLIQLGTAAFYHDIGISKYLDIINQPRELSPQEYSQIKQHPLIGPQLLDKISESLDVGIFEVMRQEHERINGSGYPKGLKDEEIIESAQIVGLSDVYEAMCHPRPYRDKHTPMEVIKAILSNKYSFAPRLVKVLIERIGIFPVGTFVQLSTKETAQVIKRNLNQTLRPVVNIILDTTGNRLKQPRQLDLANNPTIYILGTASGSAA